MDNLTATATASEWTGVSVPLRVSDDPESVLRVLRQRETDEGSLRVQLASCLNEIIRERKMTQTVVSGIFGIPQPHVSELRNHKLSRFSSERLLRFITLLDRDVEIVIRETSRRQRGGTLSVMLAS
ncbi:MAG: helix-turn-helix transcriptional regulator [Rhodocyclaceae bacterium]|nr:helix-turn-helix transcriptional regulator [Rhodocyclaceae bacterium]MDZ4214343.1 helix-turn-helix transcriptional regulator [Rhodocyclaceae bacterium]